MELWEELEAIMMVPSESILEHAESIISFLPTCDHVVAELDDGIRLIHSWRTIGHAISNSWLWQVMHGEAVSKGMVQLS